MKGNDQIAWQPWKTISKFLFLIFLVVAANVAANWVVEFLKLELRPSNEDSVHQAIMIATFVYAFLIAITFVPGVEIGLTLIALIGPGIVLLVYISTIAGLAIGFLVGRFISLKGLVGVLEWLRFSRAATLFLTIEPMTGEERLAFLVANAPSRILPVLLRHRYLALAIAINLPGNIVLGGGGGLALLAGLSRLYTVPAFLATVAIAVSPVPLAIHFFGSGFLFD